MSPFSVGRKQEESHTPIAHIQSSTVLALGLDGVDQFGRLNLQYFPLRHESRLRKADGHCASLSGMLRSLGEPNANAAIDWLYNTDKERRFLHHVAMLNRMISRHYDQFLDSPE